MSAVRGFILILIASTLCSIASAQEPARLQGKVTRADNGAPVEGAVVRIAETGQTARTARDGSYSIDKVAPGQRTVEIAGQGVFAVRDSIALAAGDRLTRDFLVIPAAATGDDVETFEIIGQPPLGTLEASDLERERSSQSLDIIPAEIMRKRGTSDVAESIKDSPAVTVKDGQFAFVRGLGERYSQTLVNGSSIPSPEPDKRVIPLDLFPASLIESIVIAKTYSAYLPAEFAGGSVQLRTIDVPEEPFFKVDLSLKYVDDTTFEDFQRTEGGDYDFLTIDDGTRDLPSSVPDQTVKEGQSLSAADIQSIGRSFDNLWETDSETALPDFKTGLSFGRKFEGTIGTIGVVGGLSWGNKRQRVDDESFRILKNQGTIQNPDLLVFNDFDLDTSTFEAELAALLNITYEASPGQRIGLRNFYTRSFVDRVREQEGLDGQQQNDIRVTQERTIERSLLVDQAWGQHLLEGDVIVDWRASYGLSQRDEPDNRQVRYDQDEATGEFLFEDVSGSGQRDYYQLDENIYDGGFDVSIPFAPIVADAPNVASVRPDQKIKLGGAFVYRDRDFDTRRFRYVPSTVAGRPVDEDGNPIDLSLPPEELFKKKNINPLGFAIEEETRPTDNYEAEQLILAGYGLVDFKLLEPLRLELGVRVEKSDQEVTTSELFGDPPQETKADLDDTDILPSINLTWKFIEDMQLRLSGSRTVSRPEFRELAEFQFTDVAGGYTARGNPDLERAAIWNADLRWEWFPGLGDLVSASIFYKRFEDPIEQVIIPTGSSLLTSWENADSADLYGFEIEVRKRLGFLKEYLGVQEGEPSDLDLLDDFSLLVNWSLMDSEVRIDKSSNVVLTEDKRPLQGQPDFVLNAGFIWDIPDFDLSIAVLANTFGDSISAVGAFGLPDEEEQQRWNLDVTVTKKLGPGSVRVTGQNLLDDDIEFKQGNITTRTYHKGFSIGLSYSLSF